MTIHSIKDNRAYITSDDGIDREVNLTEVRFKIIANKDFDGEATRILKEVIRFRLAQQETVS